MLKVLLYGLATFMETGIGVWIFSQTFSERRILEKKYYVLEWLLYSLIFFGIYNFSDDQALSTNDLVKIIANTSGKTEKLLKIPKYLISFVAKTGYYLKLPLNSERLKKLTENYIVSNQKIKKELHLDSLPVSAENGMKKTIESFKNSK